VGPLPDSIQNFTVYAAALTRTSSEAAMGTALIALLKAQGAAAVIRARGMERVD